MVGHGIILGHVLSSKGIELEKAKIDIVHFFSLPITVKKMMYFLSHAIKYFFKISRPYDIY